jgi:chromatin assembly factor 1 subunit B
LAFSSQDGFCSLVEFEDGELGSPYCLSSKQTYLFHFMLSFSLLPDFDLLFHIVLEGNVSDSDSKSTLQTANDAVLPTASVGAVAAESMKMEAEEKVDDMDIETSRDIGAITSEGSKTVTQDKAEDMIIKSIGNDNAVIADSSKNEARHKADDMVIEGGTADSMKRDAEEKTDDMIIDTNGTANIAAALLDNRETEDATAKQVSSSGSVNFGAEENALKQPINPDSKQSEEEMKADKPQSTLDGIKSRPEEKTGNQLSGSKNTPISNKPARKRITPIAIDP